MPGSLTNEAITIPLDLLTHQQIQDIQDAATYKDSSVAYQLKNSRFLNAATQKKLKDTLYVKLWRIEDDCLIIPQGFRYLVPTQILLDDKRELPPLKTMIWHKKPTKQMRYYQRECVDALKADSRGQGVMATGTGKSFTMMNLVREMGLKTLIVCPSTIIGEQLYKDFAEHLGPKIVGMYGAGKKQIKQVTIGLYQSITRNIEDFKDVQLIVCDENQTLGAGSLMAITRELGHVPYFYSVSATNYRADGRTPEIYAASGEIKYNFDTARAISEGFLAKPSFYVRSVSSAGGQYDLKQKNYTDHVVKNPALNNQIVRDGLAMMKAKKSLLVLVQEIEHGEEISTRLGLPFANGENKDSMKLIEKLNRGEIPGLVAGAQMCGIGVDTVRVDCLIMASFPGTKGLTLQLIGRGLRKYEGKTDVIILDYHLYENSMLNRHAEQRIEWYEELGRVKLIGASDG